ncbi:MAG: flagellar hook-length control protein FliK [Lachnospiraceae bacterium]|nr:flagellar hook-length control protein FliK [Lachnospiraceae bacterium]
MSFLSNLYDLGNQIQTGYNNRTGNTVRTGENGAILSNGKEASQNVSLKSGDVITGEVVETDGSNVKIKLGDNKYIDARLDSNADIRNGQSLTFEVKSEGGQTALRPLYANLSATTPQAYQALNGASLPANSTNIAMVNAMMEEGMSVNREALYAMLKDVNSFKNADPATIVQLNKLGMPVNDTNITQLDNYKNLEYKIINDADELSTGLSDMIKGDISDKITSDILSLVSTGEDESLEKIKALIEGLKELPKGADGSGSLGISDIAGRENGQVNDPGSSPGGVIAETADQAAASGTIKENAGESFLNALKEQGIAIGKGNEGIALETVSNGSETVSRAIDVSSPDALMPGAVTEGAKDVSSDILSDKGITYPDTYEGAVNELTDKLKSMGMSDEAVNELISKDIPDQKMIGFVNELMKEMGGEDNKFDPLKKALEKLLSTDEFKTGVKNALSDTLTIRPSDVSEDGKINDLYRKLLNQTDKITDILNNAGKAESHLMENASNIRNNVSFMNDLNQMMQYVQLPLKMAQENAHGDLYVYTKKKNLMNKDGNVSALLHLDMENLGPMDVYVAMQSNKVNTHFYMQDDDALDLVMQNIERLDERLKSKGYDMHTTVTTKDIKEDKGIVDVFLENASKEGTVSSVISKYSFDVRA